MWEELDPNEVADIVSEAQNITNPIQTDPQEPHTNDDDIAHEQAEPQDEQEGTEQASQTQTLRRSTRTSAPVSDPMDNISSMTGQSYSCIDIEDTTPDKILE